jgi:hypothetical protein
VAAGCFRSISIAFRGGSFAFHATVALRRRNGSRPQITAGQAECVFSAFASNRSADAAEREQAADRRLVYVVSPRHIGLRLARSKALERFLALVVREAKPQ